MNGLGFLAPALLAGLAAILVPIVLHLLQRERHDVLEFPSLMFLRQIPQETTKRRRLRHWLLLAARCLLLALLVAAFARPFLRGRAGAAVASRGAREVVVLLDRSYSMGLGDRWARAQSAARAVIDGLDGDDRATLVLFDHGAQTLNEPSDDQDALRELLARATPGAGATRYGPALRAAQGVLEESDRARREVVVVSDFQQAGWDGVPDVRLPPGTELRRVDVAAAPAPNAAVVGVDVARAPGDLTGAAGDTVILTARVRNFAPEPLTGRTVTLELNGRTLQTRAVDLPAAGVTPVVFDAVALPPGESRGTVRLAADALPPDDVHHFVVGRAQLRRVVLVEPAGAPEATSLYLRRALALAHDPAYAVVARTTRSLRAADLDDAALVVLNDVPPPDGDVGRRLAALVRGGGGVLAVLGDRSADARWSGPLAELAPIDLGRVRDRRGAGTAVGYVDRTHPVFAPFRDAGDFAAVRVFRSRDVEPPPGGTVLARYGDGPAALVDIPAGKGRVLVWSSAMDNRWSDLPVQPVFLPLVHELARHAAGRPPAAPAVHVGDRVDVARYAALHGLVLPDAGTAAPEGAVTGTGAARAAWLAIAPSGRRVRLEADAPPVLEPDEAGFWQVRALSGDDTRPRPLAVNVDPAEGDLAPLDPAAFTVAVGPAPQHAADTVAVAGGTAVERERRQSLWWYLLAAALLLLGVEAAYANRLSVRTR
ncbi:MAG TPA: BatA domain-containing protein [Gemmatimonadaceae bacterium]|nr:BatA domain-containing protein [Gemmatimonadaceae bacterium]